MAAMTTRMKLLGVLGDLGVASKLTYLSLEWVKNDEKAVGTV